ncbi:MAG: transcriptional repressor [Planctomycetes bacterium]|nr:transcriptional repressor [Planctomycetota bacterium]
MDNDDYSETAKNAETIFKAFLRKRGLSQTKSRMMVLEEIYNLEGHFTVDELEERLGDLKGSHRATIYRTIKHMMEAGLLAKVQTSSHAKVAYERTLGHQHHDHLVCDRCGNIVEFHSDEIERIQTQIAESFGFKLFHHSMVLTGICEACQKMDKKKSPSSVIVKID